MKLKVVVMLGNTDNATEENGVAKRQNGNRGSALRQIAAATGGPRDCCLEAVVSKRLPGVAPSFFFFTRTSVVLQGVGR